MASFEIEYGSLWTYDGGNPDERLPLSRLSEDGHVHGLLRIKVNGNVLPFIGYFGPDDVCFNTWLYELKSALEGLRASATSSYLYDEGEQGQPAFLFERDGDAAWLSIVASQLSDGQALPEWQRAKFSFSDFERSVLQFAASLRRQVEAESPRFGKSWWANASERGA